MFARLTDMLDLCDLADGWQFVDGRCLKFFDKPQSWFGARQTCHANQADLTLFKNYDELRNLDSLITCRTKDEIAWIGLSDTVRNLYLVYKSRHEEHKFQ